MKLRFLHLSNMHFRSNKNNKLQLSNITDSLLMHLAHEIISLDGALDFVFISGDMAHTGKPEEFQLALEFSMRLLETVKLSSSRLFIVPGNCDLTRNEIDMDYLRKVSSVKNQDEISTLFKKNIYSPKIIQKFQNFFKFANKLTNGRLYNKKEDYFFAETVQTQISLNIIGLNSCLFAGYREAGNKNLILGTPQVEEALLKTDKDALLTIALIHHQFENISPVDNRAVTMLLQNTDIIFSGHSPELSKVLKKETERAIIIKNGTPYTGRQTLYQFNITSIDLENGMGKVQFYKYLPQHNIWKKDTDSNPEQPDGHFPFIVHALRSHIMKTTNWKQDSLYISGVEITNILGFKKIKFDFKNKQQPFYSWIMLLGDNSMGKTSFLRCLALGLCDENGMSSLLDNLPPDFIHSGQKEGDIQIVLTAESGKIYQIITRFEVSKWGLSHKKEYYKMGNNDKLKKIDYEDFPLRDLFVCGYGAGRIFTQLTTNQQYQQQYKYSVAIGSLFSYSQSMQNPELSLRRIISAARTRAGQGYELEAEKNVLNQFQQLIGKLFMFDESEYIELTERGIEVISRNKREQLFTIGDGYKNTAAWLLDFLTWNMLEDRPFDPARMTGIVFIDEIEQHLHPRWQRYIIKLLRDQFPGVQFITTTHSPLCAAGTADLEETEYAIILFKRTEHEAIEAHEIDPLIGLKADQVLTSEAFNLPTTRNPKIANILTRFADLYLKERTENDEKEFSQLKEYLEENLPESAEDADSRLLQAKLKKLLKDAESMIIKKR